eukprot:SAG31_NODE_2943_length_4877_cov_5.912725_5_plen_138_part_00
MINSDRSAVDWLYPIHVLEISSYLGLLIFLIVIFWLQVQLSDRTARQQPRLWKPPRARAAARDSKSREDSKAARGIARARRRLLYSDRIASTGHSSTIRQNRRWVNSRNMSASVWSVTENQINFAILCGPPPHTNFL